ncbi:HIT domain [Geosmithia morbida]|uniref:HIT domain n=1 Tax=Geosmithia morbida TaxID=1094350 RepID=A0A9P4YRW1_9HYPO|nr:HIT domain [Geosmithia morbida]KAF4121605.1 HIT domain [Geosmithia morbida]
MSCIFCRIIKGASTIHSEHEASDLPYRNTFCELTADVGEIPSFKLFESDKTFAFLDIGPVSKGHALVIPKHHGEKLADIPDDHLTEILPVLKRIVNASGATDYNILQNNGSIAHQVVPHIPKPNETEGLIVGWPSQSPDMEKLKALSEEIKSKM